MSDRRTRRAQPARGPSLLGAAWLLLSLVVLVTVIALAMQPQRRSAPAAVSTAPEPGVRELAWAELLPPGQAAPPPELLPTRLRLLSDASPEAQAALQRLLSQHAQAPLNPTLQGQAVRMAGYVVPLEADAQGTRAFLLVPHFGACIHTPPPPRNQIVLVRLAAPAPALRSMVVVQVSGMLQVQPTDTAVAAAGYTLEATRWQVQ